MSSTAKLHEDFRHHGLRVPPPGPFSHHHGKKQTASASGRDLRHPTGLHGCAHGRQRTAHEPDCASNTCLQKGGKSVPRPPPAAPAVTKRFQRRFRKKGGKESPRRSNLLFSVFSVRGDAGEQRRGASSWMRRNARI